MQITSLHLTNFRNYADYHTKLSPLTIIIGPNGIGKTNLLEAVVVLSTTKSHRVSRDRDLIKNGAEIARIEGKLTSKTESTPLAIALSNNQTMPKTFFLRDRPIRGPEIVGCLKTVIFSPESLELIYGNPINRRRFLNNLLCQTEKDYLRRLWTYGRILQERNRLLALIAAREAGVDELDFWNQELIEKGNYLIRAREKLITHMGKNIPSLYQSLSGNKDQINITYQPNTLPDQFKAKVSREQYREIKAGVTLFGPHRDDLAILINDKPICSYGSRGEARSAVFTLKMAEIDFHKAETDQIPVLLLDDIFSELDSLRRSRILELITQTQTLITAIDASALTPKTLKQAQIIDLTKK